MKIFLVLVCFIFVINYVLAEGITYNDVLGSGKQIVNIQPFSTGIKKISFNLEISNGKATIRILSEEDYALYREKKPYKRYMFITDQPFNSLHTETGFINFPEKFYIIITNDNLIEDIYVYGDISMTYPVIEDRSYIIWIIVGCSLAFTILVLAILGRCIYLLFRSGKCCSGRTNRNYTVMSEITEEEKIFSSESS